MINTFGFEWIEEFRRQISAEKTAGMRVVVDPLKQQTEHSHDERVLQSDLRCLTVPGAASVIDGGTEQSKIAADAPTVNCAPAKTAPAPTTGTRQRASSNQSR